MIYGDEEWARQQTVSLRVARQTYREHGLSEAELILDLGEHTQYSGAAILDALGY